MVVVVVFVVQVVAIIVVVVVACLFGTMWDWQIVSKMAQVAVVVDDN